MASTSRSSAPNPFFPPLSNASRLSFFPTVHEPHVFHPYQSLSMGGKGAIWSGGVGLAASALQNAVQRHDAGFWGVFTRTGGTIVTFTLMGFAFPFVNAVTANIRQTDDSVNPAVGGCAAGFIGGIRQGSFPAALGACVFLGATFYTINENDMLLSDPKGSENRTAQRAEWFKPYEKKPLPNQ
ncbi:hypothetical protein BD324DRAFT_637641 [Kockovaella imperatae]|uniref:Uncharacterized protein n=1 Tax=Kockovaella imperatae TaxID=4999 RepID=A0A1Y1U8S8_9TREE|nr:hypothetical protein BD324DRAFT_637641 [Kockovaella imperatae]ORX33896.1 hypothetical protein BD324DRAFT_637641 [Kockovaella imperatae]